MGRGAKSRLNAQKAKAKQAVKKSQQREAKFIASLPKVTEGDLLSFQLLHFGDDSQPNNWFVDQATALKSLDFEEEHLLGCYDDGVKRTLTDEQIAVFRRTELWQMKRNQEQQKETKTEETQVVREGARSPISEASSLEDELLQYSSISRQRGVSEASRNRRSETRDSAGSWKQRRSQHDVPYSERHKRKWEDYIDKLDPVEGSLTYRRLARELDNQHQESIEMEY